MSDAITVRVGDVPATEIARWLTAGAVVIVPTETVYGLAITPGNAARVRRMFELKARPEELNLPVVIGAVDQLHGLGVDFNDRAKLLADHFWPGPLTLVLGFSGDDVRPEWLAGRAEVAIRFPGMALLREVALAAGPLLLTSANAHGTGPKRIAAEAAASLKGEVDYIVDGGLLSDTPSTIVNMRHTPARIERVGAVSAAELETLLPVVTS